MLLCPLKGVSKWGILRRYQGVRQLSAQAALKEKKTANKMSSGDFSVGKVYSGFMCTKIQHIKDFNMDAILLKHEKSNTEYLHLNRDDPNNVFSINFRTTPFSSSGLPHILEHTVLCGSSKYPVRDPFFKMLNRSLATFMNAMTGPDYTFYPFSSQNEVDYRNLQSIYLDAVFKPNLKSLDFLQEGWRLEHSNLKDPKSDITFKGVVFNEMKGAFSENSSVFAQKFLNSILPDHTYGYVSGGDPLDIPNLTVTQLREFHQKYYHPSNARIYSYGNFPLERNLQICNDLYFNDYTSIDSAYSRVPSQQRWTKPKELQIESRFDKMGAPFEKQNQIAVGYLMCDITDVYETFVLQMLSALMVSGPSAPFYKSLIEPNISGGFNSMTCYDTQLRDTMFSIGLQDLEVNKFDEVKKIVDHTIDRIIEKGFEKSHIDSVLHGIELAIKHQHTRFGMYSLFTLVAFWNHEGDLVEAMQVSNYLNQFKENLKNPRYLSERVEHYFKKNNHRLTMTMVPDEAYETKMSQLENDLLKSKINNLTEADRKQVYETGLKLAETQKAQENINILPCLQLKDIPKEITPVAFEEKSFNVIPTQLCKANTNRLTYLRGVIDTSDLKEDLKMLIPVFNDVINKMDTKRYGYQEFDEIVNTKTGGLGFNTHIYEKINDPSVFEQGVSISSHCLDQNLEGMLDIWREVYDKPQFKDVDRFKMLLDNYLSNLTTGIAQSGHLYAMQCANSLVKDSAMLKESLTGLKHIEYIKHVLKTQSTEKIMEKISQITDLLMDRNRLRMAVNFSKENSEVVLKNFDHFCNALPQGNKKSQTNEIIYTKVQNCNPQLKGIHHVMNIPVNFCAKSIVTVPFTHPDFAKLRVLAKFLSSKYLHPVVREQNGAYGGGAKITNDGLFNFYSYRDPNNKVTLDVFDSSAEWFANCPSSILDDQAIFEAKLGVLQQLDVPVAEFYKGIDNFMYGLSHEVLQKHRNEVLSVTKEGMVDVCKKYLAGSGGKIVGKCVIGPEIADDEKGLKKDGEEWTVSHPIPEE